MHGLVVVLTAIVDFLEKGGWDRMKKRERDRLSEEVRDLENRKDANEPRAFGSIGPVINVGETSPGTDDFFDILGSLASLVFQRK